MSKRGAIELSLNAIVIIIFAITILGLGLAFITGLFGQVSEKLTFPVPDIQATVDNQIVLPFETLTVSKGQQAEFSVNFYNNNNESLKTRPVITECAPTIANVNESVNAVSALVSVGSTQTFKILFNVPSDINSGKYTCNLDVGIASKQFFIDVK